MRSFRLQSVRTAIVAGLASLVLSCSDSSHTAAPPTAFTAGPSASMASTAPSLADQIDALIVELFKNGHETSVASRWRNVQKEMEKNDSDAREKFLDLVDWIQKKTRDIQPPRGESGEHAAARLILLMSAYVYEGPTATVPVVTATTDAVLAIASPRGGAKVRTRDGHASLYVPAGAVVEPTIVVITRNDAAITTACRGALPTTLCQYPPFYEFNVFPDVKLEQPATVGLCVEGSGAPAANVLRIAHRKPTDPTAFHPRGTVNGDVEILPSRVADIDLQCEPSRAVGGEVLMFSPFGVVNPSAAPVVPTQLVVSGPSSSAVHESFSVAVELRDAAGALATTSTETVTLVAMPCDCAPPEGSSPPGAVSRAAVAGRATFDDLSIFDAGNWYMYARTASGLSAFSTLIIVTPGPVRSIQILEGNLQSATAGTAVAVAPRVILRDAYGNATGRSGVPIDFFVRAGGGSVATPHSNSNIGMASAGTWTLGPLAGPNVIVAYAMGALDSAVFVATGTVPIFKSSSLTTGWDFTCAVSATLPYCWGDNAFSQLGDGTQTPRNRPTLVGGGITHLLQISGGQRFACGLATGGAAVCWGSNLHGQLGIDAVDLNQNATPVGVVGGHSFTQISAGFAHVCALEANGFAWCWGAHEEGNLGVGIDRTGFTHPLQVAPPEGEFAQTISFTQIDVGGNTSCGVSTSGDIWCWGSNTGGALGAGSFEQRAWVPVKVAGGRRYTEVSVGTVHACGVSAGSVYCWGNNNGGQLGIGSSPGFSLEPALVAGIQGTVTHVAAGNMHTCATATVLGGGTGATYCWGDNSFGQLGNLTQTASPTPMLVNADGGFTAIAAGLQHTCASRANGDTYCWGSNGSGRLGIGVATPLRTAPVPVVLPIPSPSP